jgi:indole-3-glycerol phosphate synthase
MRRNKSIDLKQCAERNIIAEIKRKSPSRGFLKRDLDPEALAKGYVRAGAKGISVLTDKHFFGGSGHDLMRVASVARDIPVLRKDFIVDEIQLFESANLGADLVLLIARILKEADLKFFINRSAEIGLIPLVEVHNRQELDSALESGADFIGINNRDLETFQVDIALSEKLLPLIPRGKTRVVESGINNRDDMEKLEDLGADAFLIGEALMLADEPAKQLMAFLKKNKRSLT